MKQQWLTRAGGPDLTLVFGGWGLGAQPFEGLIGAPDVLFLDDYRHLDTDLTSIKAYPSIRLLAYSFGGGAARHWLAGTGVRPQRAVAVNGTAHPASHAWGIAPQTIITMADTLTQDSFVKFCARAGHRGALPDANIPALQGELRAIARRGRAPEIAFDRIWISDRDRIVPTRSQKAAWALPSRAVRSLYGPHQPFEAGQHWEAWFA